MSLLTPTETEALRVSLQVASLSTIISFLPSVALAWLLARKEFPGKMLLDALVHLPLVLPPVAVGYALLVLLGRGGALGGWLDATFGITLAFTWVGAAIAAGIMALPLMVRAMRLSLEAVDRKLEAAARTLGANRWTVFRTITLPLMAPGLMSGSVLGFARALGEFGATITFAGNIEGVTQTLPTAIYTAQQLPGGDVLAIRLALLSFVIALLAMIGSEVLARRVRLHRPGEIR